MGFVQLLYKYFPQSIKYLVFSFFFFNLVILVKEKAFTSKRILKTFLHVFSISSVFRKFVFKILCLKYVVVLKIHFFFVEKRFSKCKFTQEVLHVYFSRAVLFALSQISL